MFICLFIKLGGTPLPWFERDVQKEKENFEAKAYFCNKTLLVFLESGAFEKSVSIYSGIVIKGYIF
jgi:hypothetical protein